MGRDGGCGREGMGPCKPHPPVYPPVNRLIERCENITFRILLYAVGNNTNTSFRPEEKRNVMDMLARIEDNNSNLDPVKGTLCWKINHLFLIVKNYCFLWYNVFLSGSSCGEVTKL